MNDAAKKAMAFALSFIVVFALFSFWFAGASAAVPKKPAIQEDF